MKTLLLFLTLSSVLIAQEDHVYKDLISALKNPQQVYHLKLRRKSLTQFPQELSSFPNLKVLDLSKNKITTMDSVITHHVGDPVRERGLARLGSCFTGREGCSDHYRCAS